MNRRGAAIQGGLAAMGLILAYATWQREPDTAASEVIVVEAGKSDLTRLRFEEGAKFVELSSDGKQIWIRTSPRTELPKAPERRVKGSEGALKFWERFTPLKAQRALGALAADKLKEVGLAEPKKKLVVGTRGGDRVFLIGSSPFGVSDPYVKEEASGQVYVLSPMLLADLESAGSRFVERQLHDFQPLDFDAVTVEAGGKKRELVQVAGETPFLAKLAPKSSPDKPDEQAKNWHDKVWRLIVAEVLGEGEKPDGGLPKVALRLDYTHKGKPRGFLEVGSVTPPAPPAVPDGGTPPPPLPELYARSEHTAGWVRLAGASEELLKEAVKIAATP